MKGGNKVIYNRAVRIYLLPPRSRSGISETKPQSLFSFSSQEKKLNVMVKKKKEKREKEKTQSSHFTVITIIKPTNNLSQYLN